MKKAESVNKSVIVDALVLIALLVIVFDIEGGTQNFFIILATSVSFYRLVHTFFESRQAEKIISN